jgi:hypothetical protein
VEDGLTGAFWPGDAGLFATLLPDDLVYFQLVGISGWAGTPAAFQVVTSAICWELRHALRSRTLMYVDDVAADLSATRDICTSLLGPKAVADNTTETGRRK